MKLTIKQNSNYTNYGLYIFIFFFLSFLPQLMPILSNISFLYKLLIEISFILLFLYKNNFLINKKALYICIILSLFDFVSMIYTLQTNVTFTGISNYVVFIITILLFLGILPNYKYQDKDLYNFLKYFLIFMFISVIYNIVVNFKYLSSFMSLSSSYDVYFCSFFDNKNTYGIFLFYGIVAAIYFEKYDKKVAYIMQGLLFITNIFTLCRTSLLVSIIFLVIESIYNKNYRKLLIIIFVILILVRKLLIDSHFYEQVIKLIIRPNSDMGARVNIWNSILQDFDIFSLIFGKSDFVTSEYFLAHNYLNVYTHNSYITYILYGGIIRLLFIFGLMIKLISSNFNKKRNTDYKFIICLFFCYFIYSFGENISLLQGTTISFINNVFIILIPIMIRKSNEFTHF